MPSVKAHHQVTDTLMVWEFERLGFVLRRYQRTSVGTMPGMT